MELTLKETCNKISGGPCFCFSLENGLKVPLYWWKMYRINFRRINNPNFSLIATPEMMNRYLNKPIGLWYAVLFKLLDDHVLVLWNPIAPLPLILKMCRPAEWKCFIAKLSATAPARSGYRECIMYFLQDNFDGSGAEKVSYNCI